MKMWSWGRTLPLPQDDSDDADVRGSGLSKSFPDGRGVRRVLDNVDVIVSSGELVAVAGPSGCGKTTLLHMLVGLLAPDTGTARINGIRVPYGNMRALAALRRHHVGLVSQQYGLMDELSIRRNVELPLRFDRPKVSSSERRTAVLAALESVGLDIAVRRKVGTLSLGEQQRVALARAMVRRPRILVADEPTASLDQVAGADIVSLLRRAAMDSTAVLLASHDTAVLDACDRVYQFHGPHLVINSAAPGETTPSPETG